MTPKLGTKGQAQNDKGETRGNRLAQRTRPLVKTGSPPPAQPMVAFTVTLAPSTAIALIEQAAGMGLSLEQYVVVLLGAAAALPMDAVAGDAPDAADDSGEVT